jgi:Glycosyl transferase family 90
LDERVGWAQTHVQEVRAMVGRACRFACGSLSDAALLGYMRLLLTRYASLLRGF